MRKYIGRIICIVVLSSVFLYGCSSGNEASKKGSEQGNVTAVPTEAVVINAPAEGTDITATEVSTESEPTQALAQEDKGAYDPNFELTVEAEDAVLSGKVKAESTKQGFTGTGYLTGIEEDSDTVTFTITVPGSGAYDLNFISASYSGHKENHVLVDGEVIGVAVVESSEFTDSIMKSVYLTTGSHDIKMTKSWGWIYLDSLKVTTSAPADETIYTVSSKLIDAKATDRTKRLMQYMTDMYGKYIISGQYADKGINSNEFKAIKQTSGKVPAILGQDLIEYSPSRVAHGSSGRSVVDAIEFDKLGGIITFCWHWNAPDKYLINASDNPWWRGFYTDASTIDLKKIMDGEDKEGYDLLISDIDAIAVQLKKLQDADVPILWRPLHEASGGWFWWGATGPEAYIKLYQLLYDRLTNYHNIHNLIWVWNGQNKDWYPGDEYVDIVGTDIYPGERVYSAQVAKFDELVQWNGDNKKIVTLSENGCLFDPDLAFRDNAKWSYFATWQGEFVTLNNTYTLSEKYTEKDMVNKVYNHEKIITLDELPDLKTYGN